MSVGKKLSSLVLLASLAVPVATFAQDHDRDDHHDREHRYYDREHKDYHRWDNREDAAYRHWITEERHRRYVEFGHLRPEDQRAYWAWRHDHADWHR